MMVVVTTNLHRLFYYFIIITVLLATTVMAETRECEDETSYAFGGVGVDGMGETDQANASGGKGFRLGPNWNQDANSHWGEGDYVTYDINLQAYDNASISIQYSDDIAGNVIKVYLVEDGNYVEKGQFTTIDTGVGWGDFVWTSQITLGAISAGTHTIKLEIAYNGGGGVGVLLDYFEIDTAPIICGTIKECEDFTSYAFGGVGLSDGTGTVPEANAFGGWGLRLGPNWHQDSNSHWGEGDYAIYDVNLEAYDSALLRVRYSDDAAGNTIKVYLLEDANYVEKGQFTSVDTGYAWGNFGWAEPIFLGSISAGMHTIKLEIAYNGGGNVGVLLDAIHIRDASVVDANAENFVAFIKSSINLETGLVESREGDYENRTTVFKNGLAAMAFLRSGDTNSAEGIFNFFKSVYEEDVNDFPGFVQNWDAETGQPMGANYWVGDGAFLLLALNYYNQVNGSYGDYRDLAYALVEWIAEVGNTWNSSLATEGAANAYAALAPFEGDEYINNALIRLKGGFYETAEFVNYLDHIGRAALVFGDLDGFDYVSSGAITQTWEYDNTTQISAYRDSTDKNDINIEICAQLLNAWDIWSSDLTLDLSGLENELEKTRISGFNNSYSCGLPYWVKELEFNYSCSLPIIDPTAFMCYNYWSFNPFAPGEKCVPDLSFDFSECEDYNYVVLDSNTYTGFIGFDGKGNASGGVGLHLGPNSPGDGGVGDEAVYVLDLQAYGDAAIRIRYSDDEAGNVIKVYLDDAEKGQFTTADTSIGVSDWNDFEWTEPIPIGLVSEGEHTIKLEMTTGGSVGILLDVFKIESIMAPPSRVIGWGGNNYGEAIAPAGADFIDIKSDGLFNVALREDGSLYVWGPNEWGQCNVPDDNNYIAIGAGPATGYAIKKDGSLVAWGKYTSNMCDVPDGNDFIAVEGILDAGIALKNDGSLVAFGDANNYGQQQVPAGNDFVAISGYNWHYLALENDGTIAAWGNNSNGQCNVPTGNYTAIAAGDRHSLAIKDDGSLVAWGYNYYGQCEVPDGNDFVAISAGSRHSIAMRADGSAVAWGGNAKYQLNARKGVHYTAIAAGGPHSLGLIDNGPSGTIENWGNSIYHQGTPFGDDFVAVDAGPLGPFLEWHSAALRSDGSLVVWGNNPYVSDGAMYGTGDTYVYGQMPSGNDFVDVETGSTYGLALKKDGSLFRWGSGNMTPSGNNYTAISVGSYFSAILRDDGSLVGSNVPDGNDYIAISAGGYHAVAMKYDGSLVAWGDNSYGQCNVPAGNDFVSISAGECFTIAMKRDGSTVAWGHPSAGIIVPSPNDFIAISAGVWTGYGINYDTSLTSWGGYIQPPCDGYGFVKISAGTYHGLAIRPEVELLTSYEPEETNLDVNYPSWDPINVVECVQGGVNGAPEATEGSYVLKLDWTDDDRIQINHSGLDILSFKGKRFVFVDIYLTSQLPAAPGKEVNMGIWNSIFDWQGADVIPTQTNEWFTLVIDISDDNCTRITGDINFIIENMATTSTSTVYLDNIRIVK